MTWFERPFWDSWSSEPFSPQIMPFDAPNAAHCGNATALTCTADFSGGLSGN
jgi:hypothetical protein